MAAHGGRGDVEDGRRGVRFMELSRSKGSFDLAMIFALGL